MAAVNDAEAPTMDAVQEKMPQVETDQSEKKEVNESLEEAMESTIKPEETQALDETLEIPEPESTAVATEPEQGPESELPSQTTDATGNVDGAQSPSAETSLVRRDAISDIEEILCETTCKKCGVTTKLEHCVARGPKEVWCKECNALYTMLRRHQQWPPAGFVSLPTGAQQAFFKRCKDEKAEACAQGFSYKTVRNSLIAVMAEEVTRSRKVAVGGTYLPLSVLAKQGYEIDDDFTQRNPSLWSKSLNCWTYLVSEVSVNHEEIHASVEKEVLEAERLIKHKRKALESTALKEIEDGKTEVIENDEDLDLDSDSEEEGSLSLGITGWFFPETYVFFGSIAFSGSLSRYIV